ncbi:MULTISPECIES: hypothetical protein [Bradyrhizobium]|uniref:Uncharacterized protein n=1 Tax=Bradyrhizobium elkanii TaxID=29448 RepID=A0A8I2C463_BRAEL|nr:MULTISPECIES: hypothetical protein [Bradyrhizobium]MBP1294339.1 hypothetical protein [Bradyrhizobium elkanii]MCP1925272.1 hypothetical protein [Bradyrhizobium elkanii]MCP1966788.1 hypothetical protein [Bradyrhizobium elkanii]MCS3477235.1 hypothetical protein [Bradyrhizobium elkanii]MCS3522953.1 hypothetical protein [Bradyrhizobium elkanii]
MSYFNLATITPQRSFHPMASPKVEEYRRRAREAEALAEAVDDQAAKETLLEAAERWQKLANQAQRNGW